jgi:hypothetical protein
MYFKGLYLLVAGCAVVGNATAGDYVLGQNFVVKHPTTIDQLGAYDGGTAFTGDVSVGIFDAITGNLVGPDVLFGPGLSGTQIGNTFYESVTPFVLQPGEYSVVAVGAIDPNAGGSTGTGLSDVNSYENLGGALNLPGSGRFNSGTAFAEPGLPGSGSGNNIGSSSQFGGFQLVDPVPDGGLTVALLGASLAGLGWLRRKM